MKKIFLYALIVVAALLTATGGYFYFSLQQKGERTVEINNQLFKVEIASTPEERSRGLSGRENLCEDCGMLFEFPEPGNYSFWMKGMNFPLDIIWIRENRVVYVARNISSEHQGTINPGVEADKVLEINSGLSEEYEIEEGNEVISR